MNTEGDMIVPGLLQGVAGCCSVLQCVAVCCSVLQCVATHTNAEGDVMVPGDTTERDSGPSSISHI